MTICAMWDSVTAPADGYGSFELPAGIAAPRLTLVTRHRRSLRDWNVSATRSLTFLDVNANAVEVLADVVADESLDVARIIIDGCLTTRDFLDVLTSVPHSNAADILWIDDDGSAYLSAGGRGGDRLLYRLKAHDVDFYLAVHGLLVG